MLAVSEATKQEGRALACGDGRRVRVVMADGTACLALALQVQTSAGRLDLPLHAGMAQWSEEQLRKFFSETRQQTKSTCTKSVAPQSIPVDTEPLAKRKSGGISGSVWRSDYLLRKTHWLCKSCNVALPRETACCERCGGADFSSSGLDGPGTVVLASRLRESSKALTSLDVSHNALGPSGVAAIAAALRAVPRLTSLDLSGSGASDAGAIALSEALRPGGPGGTGDLGDAAGSASPPTQLRTLTLTGCSIKEDGGSALAALSADTARTALGGIARNWRQF